MRRKPFVKYLASLFAAGASLLVGCQRSSAAARKGVTHSMMSDPMMGGSMMNVSQADMQIYMEMFNHHRDIHRIVERLPNGVRTVTESDNARIATLLKEHVPSMYAHVNAGEEVRCMSNSLPTMFHNASKYVRQLELTRTGVVVTETSDDPVVLAAIRRHADEVSGFVKEGMPAMMRGMMQQ